MDRIKKMQRADNLYESYVGKEHFAYVPLEWDCSARLIQGFANNLKDENIHPDVWEAHGITKEEITNLKGAESISANKVVIEKLKKSINWSELEKKVPLQEHEQLARSVSTNLTALSHKEIECLAEHSAWLTEVQVRLYMPMLVTNDM